MLIYNIPLSSNFLITFADYLILQHKNSIETEATKKIILLPSKRAVKKLRDILAAKVEKDILPAVIIPKIITYSQIPNNILEFINLKPSANLPDLDFIIPNQLSDLELLFIIKRILIEIKSKQLNAYTLANDKKINDIYRAILEYYYYGYDIRLLQLGNSNEQLLALIIEKLEQYLIKLNKLLEPQRQNYANNLIQEIANNGLLLDIYAVLPVAQVSYINKFFSIAKNSNIDIRFFLQGFNKEKDSKTLANLSEKNPNYHIYNFLQSIKAKPDDVEDIEPITPYDDFISQLTFEMHSLTNLSQIKNYPLNQVKILESKSQLEQAEIIGLIIREYIASNNPGSISIVTTDRTLVIMLKQQLKLWNIQVNDSVADKLIEQKEVKFFLTIFAYLIQKNFDHVLFLSIVKDFRCNLYDNHLDLILKFEINCLRELPYQQDILDYFAIIPQEIRDLLQPVEAFCLLLNQYKQLVFQELNFQNIAKLHLELFKLILTPKYHIFQSVLDLELLITNVSSKQYLEMPSITPDDYFKFLAYVLERIDYREDIKQNLSDVIILTPIEARLLNYDLIIFAGLQEENFSKNHNEQSLISNNIRKNHQAYFNADTEIGYTGHDFFHLLSNKKVILSYINAGEGLRNQPMKLLEILKIYLDVNLKITDNNLIEQYYEKKYHSWIQQANNQILYQPISRAIVNCSKEILPNNLSVSAIEKLIRNPYAYYARYILNLKPMNQICTNISYKDFGIILHDVLSEVIQLGINDNYDLYKFQFEQVYNSKIAKMSNIPIVKYLWYERFQKIAEWFFAYEQSRKNEIIQSYTEIEGSIKMRYPGTKEVSIMARFDRIDLFNNNITIIDYKSGVSPSNTDVINGLYPQLALEGLILVNNGVQNLEFIKLFPVDIKLCYLEIHGKNIIAQEKIIKANIKDAEIGLKCLIEMFWKDNSPFFATLEYDDSFQIKDYKHLSRTQEWFNQAIK